MLQSILNSLFGCSHKRTTFPLTPARRNAGFPVAAESRHGTYVVCLDCGKELGYNWSEMRIGPAVEPKTPAGAAQPSFR